MGVAAMNEQFHQFYRDFWGDRWDRIFASLQSSEVQVARLNAFSSLIEGTCPAPSDLWKPQYPDLFLPRSIQERGPEGLLIHYVMDPASVFVARQLRIKSGDQVLDMCAAPGGKSLILVEALFAQGLGDKSGAIILNEVSETRRERLKKVVQQYVPRDVRDHLHLAGKDGGRFALTHPENFDAILVDAPCSGERHLLGNLKELEEWKPKRSKVLAQRQYALLTGALEALKPGGSLVYSTCSVSKWENEAVVEKFLKKKAGRVELDPVDVTVFNGENEQGMGYFLPDHCGFGPLFVARFRKSFGETEP